MRAAMPVLMALAVLAAGCSWIEQRKAIQNCDFDLYKVTLDNADFTGALFGVTLKVDNPNDIDAVLDRIDYDFKLEGSHVASGVVSKKQTIKRKSTGYVSTSVNIKYSDIPKLKDVVIRVVTSRKANVGVDAKVHFDFIITTISYPVSLSRTFNF